MPFRVNLTLRGLCALVPSETIQVDLLGSAALPVQRIAEMKVLVLDASQSRIIPNRDTPSVDLEVCAHLPILRYPSPGENRLSNFLILDGHRIEISDIDTAQPLEIRPSFKNWASMEKVLSDQNPNAARVAPSFLAADPVAGIAARLDLRSGIVEAKKSEGVWDFLPSPAEQVLYRDRFASEIQVSIPITSNQAELSIVKNGSVEDRQILRPRTANQSVSLLLSNLCFEEEERPQIEEDFAVFYDLLTNYTGPIRVPHLIGGQNQGGGQGSVPGGASRISCVGAFMAASS